MSYGHAYQTHYVRSNMIKVFAALFILVAIGITAVPQKQQPQFVTTGVGISVHLRQPPGPFVFGKPIAVQMGVSNDSKQTLMVCRDLDIGSESCFWDFETRD